MNSRYALAVHRRLVQKREGVEGTIGSGVVMLPMVLSLHVLLSDAL